MIAQISTRAADGLILFGIIMTFAMIIYLASTGIRLVVKKYGQQIMNLVCFYTKEILHLLKPVKRNRILVTLKNDGIEDADPIGALKKMHPEINTNLRPRTKVFKVWDQKIWSKDPLQD